MARTRKPRLEATRLIIERLEKGPAYPRQLAEELGIGESTIKHNLGKTLPKLGLIRQLEDGRYVLKYFCEEEGKVKAAFELLRTKLFRSPKPEEVAPIIKEKPGDARDLLFKYVQDYSEPTEEQIQLSSIKQLEMVCYGIDLPKKDILLSKGLKSVQAWGINGEFLLNYYNKRDKFGNWSEAEAYLRNFPELAPTIYKYGTNSVGEEIDTLYLEFEWPEAVQSIINSLPELRKGFEEKCEISISSKFERSIATHKKPYHLCDETITEYI